MTDEAGLNTIIKNSLQWGSKVPDPGNDFAKATARPFDGFGILNGKPFYWEAKFSKKIESFSLQDIRDHQIENLCKIKELNPSSHCWVILGIKVGRADNRIYIFDDPFVVRQRRDEKKNYLKKELETLPYLLIKKELIDLSAY